MIIKYRRFSTAMDLVTHDRPCIDPRLLAAQLELAAVVAQHAGADTRSPFYEVPAEITAARQRLRDLKTELGII